MYALLHTACQCDLCTTQVQIVYKHLIHGCDFPWTFNTLIKHFVLHEELIRNAIKILTLYLSFEWSVLCALVKKLTSLDSPNQNIYIVMCCRNNQLQWYSPVMTHFPVKQNSCGCPISNSVLSLYRRYILQGSFPYTSHWYM